MKSGSKEIQQRMKQQVPRINMGMKEWIGEVAKFYGCTYTKAENLYYRPGHSIPNTIYVKLHSLSSTGQPRPQITTDNLKLQELNAALEVKLKEAGEKQERLDHDFKRMVRGLQALCESLQAGSTLGRS